MNGESDQLLPLELYQVEDSLRVALEQAGVPACDAGSRPVTGRFLVYDSRRCRRPVARLGQRTIDLWSLTTELGENPLRQLADEHSAASVWRYGGLELREEVARYDKATLRQTVLAHLRERVEADGGVWCRLSTFPFPYRSALNFRIDYDVYDSGDFRRTLKAVDGFDRATSHFVNGAAYATHTDALTQMQGLDVGSHGYWHHVYRDAAENKRNVARGIEVLRQAKLEPRGFVAPHGRFNRGLLAALEALGVTHSSEFGLAYDDLPFFPAGSSVLQIPVHPVCLGLFLDAVRTSDTSADAETLKRRGIDLAEAYFRRTAHAKYLAGQPIFFYGHPTGRLGQADRMLRGWLEEVSGYAAVWPVTFTEFARWWRVRSRMRMSVLRRPEGYEVRLAGERDGYRFGIEFWRGEHVAVVPMDGPVLRFSPESLIYERRRTPKAEAFWRIDPSDPVRKRLLRAIDWERVTPLAEIQGSSWRHVAKRTLRRIRPSREEQIEP